MSTEDRSRAWIEVRAAALVRNYQRIEHAAGPGVRLLPMVKADGYGLGAESVCRALEPLGPAGFGVATVDRARRLRTAGIGRRIVVFTPLAPGEERAAARHRLECVVGDAASIARARHAGLNWHLEIDTGMGRAGVPWRTALDDAPALRETLAPGTGATGVFTHFHSADEPGAPEVDLQFARFGEVLTRILPDDGTHLDIHVANSAGALLELPESPRRTLVRPGIHLYGGRSGPELPAPDPVVAVRARIVRVVEVEPGAPVGYGATHRAAGPERWATLAIGYGDGVPRALSNRGEVLIGGRRAPVVGRVSMDMTVANISGLEGVRVGDVATLIGRDVGAEITIDEVAGWAGTISYEVLTGLSPRLPRIWETGE